MSKSSRILRIVAVLALLPLAGCSMFRASSCTKPGPYLQAKEATPLKIPSGLDAPDTRGALRIPELREPEVPREAGTCLDKPPKFTSPAPRPAA